MMTFCWSIGGGEIDQQNVIMHKAYFICFNFLWKTVDPYILYFLLGAITPKESEKHT